MLRLGLRLGLRAPVTGAASTLAIALTSILDSRIAFTRSTTGTYFDNTGALQTAAIDTARFDHDPVTLAAKGLLIEEARTNLALRSADLSNATWTKGSTTVSGEEITQTAPNAEVYQTVTVTASTTYTFSFWAKRGTATDLKYCVYNNSGATFPVADTSYYSQINSSTWTRVAVTFTTPVGCTSIRIYPTRSGGNGTASIRRLQLEAGAFATSYIPTAGSTVNRAADIASMTGSNFSGWFNASEGTFIVEADSIGSGTRPVISADDNTANERINLYTSTLDPKMLIVDGGVSQADIDAGSITAATAFKLGAAFKLNDCAVSVGGGAEVTDTSATIPTVDRLRIGADQAGNYLNGHVKAITFYASRLPLAVLTA